MSEPVCAKCGQPIKEPVAMGDRTTLTHVGECPKPEVQPWMEAAARELGSKRGIPWTDRAAIIAKHYAAREPVDQIGEIPKGYTVWEATLELPRDAVALAVRIETLLLHDETHRRDFKDIIAREVAPLLERFAALEASYVRSIERDSKRIAELEAERDALREVYEDTEDQITALEQELTIAKDERRALQDVIQQALDNGGLPAPAYAMFCKVQGGP